MAEASRLLGERAFAAIMAVEGLKLNAASRRRLAALSKSNLSREQCRAEILRAYRK